MEKNKVLIIRFSSFGDIVQCSSAVDLIDQKFPMAQIHWVTRSEFASLVSLNQHIDKVWSFQKKEGFRGLLSLGMKLRTENYDFVFDAHNNVRSKILSLFLKTRFKRPQWVTRPKDRFKRILLFTFRINLFPRPFKGILSYLAPLNKWGISSHNYQNVSWQFPEIADPDKQEFLKQSTSSLVLVPSAAWEMKRWPLSSWKELITLMPHQKFIVLGGKEDTFCEELVAVAPERVINLAGKLSLIESCALIKESQLVISADTGLLHVADVLNKKAIALIGPTAFGFTTSSRILTMEVDLPCRPCTKDGRGHCSQSVYQKCMVDITPVRVATAARQLVRE